MISDDELHIKHQGICLARDYDVKEAIPIIEAEANNEKTPSPFNNMSYGCSIGRLAKMALEDLK